MASSKQRSFLTCWLLLLGSLTILLAYVHAHKASAWYTEDWLINYEAGFVRRGVSGALAKVVQRLIGLNPVWSVFALQVSCYLVILYSAYFLLKARSGWSAWLWAAIVSPATFSYQLIDPGGGYRKEIIFFAGLSGLLVMLRKNASERTIAAYLILLLPLEILAHEGLLAYLGYYLAALIVADIHWYRALRIMFFPLVLALAAMGAAVTHHGTATIAARICESLGQVDPPPCGGAIGALGETMEQGRLDLLTVMHKYSYGWTYGITGMLAILPVAVLIVAAFRSPRTRSSARIICISAAISLLLSIPSYIYAMDWGRWIYIQVFTLTLFLIFLDGKYAGVEPPINGLILENGRGWTWVALLLYATCWTLPHVPTSTHFGVVQRLVRFLGAYRNF